MVKKRDFVKLCLHFTQIETAFYLSQPICQKQKQCWKQYGVASELRQVKAHTPQIIEDQIFEIILVYTDVKSTIDNRRHNAEEKGHAQCDRCKRYP